MKVINKSNFLSFKLILIFPMILLGVFYGSLAFGQTGGVNCAPSQHKLEIQLPGFNKCVNGPADYLSSLYKLSLGIGVFLAAVVIVMAGIKYATSGDNAGNQKAAREDITQAIFGLLILFGSVIILRTINPDLADLGKWENLPKTEIPKTDEAARTACIECKNQANQELNSFKMNNDEYLKAKKDYDAASNGSKAAGIAAQKMRELEDAEQTRVFNGCVSLCESVPNEEI